MSAEQVIDGILDWDMGNQLRRLTGEARRAAEDSKKKTCGRCHWWMKSKDCPAEKNVRGISRGPSSGSNLALTCSKFRRSEQAKELTRRLESEADQTAKATSFAELPNRNS